MDYTYKMLIIWQSYTAQKDKNILEVTHTQINRRLIWDDWQEERKEEEEETKSSS